MKHFVELTKEKLPITAAIINWGSGFYPRETARRKISGGQERFSPAIPN